MTKRADQIIARRKTADDKAVALWSDGSLTWGGVGTVIKGSPHARTDKSIQEALAAGWLVMGEVELYDADEVTRLIEHARKVAARGGDPGDLRREFARRSRIRPHWETLEADRAGKPRLRIWRLPRMSHPGLAVWDDLSSRGRGRYHVMREIKVSGTYAPTGVQFHDLDQLATHLDEISELASRVDPKDDRGRKTKAQLASEIDEYLAK